MPKRAKIRGKRCPPLSPPCNRDLIHNRHTAAKNDKGSLGNDEKRANAAGKVYRRRACDWNKGFVCERHWRRAVAPIIWTSHSTHRPRLSLQMATKLRHHKQAWRGDSCQKSLILGSGNRYFSRFVKPREKWLRGSGIWYRGYRESHWPCYCANLEWGGWCSTTIQTRINTTHGRPR